MRELSFNIEAARRYGVDGAILLHGMAAWIAKNRANERHFHDGRWWTYNSKQALARLFPFWSEKQLRRIVKALSEEGALLLGNYSDGSYHNTTWYALSDDVLELLGAESCLSTPEKTTCPNGQVVESTCPNGQEYLPKRAEDKQIDTTSNPPIVPPTGGAPGSHEINELVGIWYRDGDIPPGDGSAAHTVAALIDVLQRAPRSELETCLKRWRASCLNHGLPLWKVLEHDGWREEPWFWIFWQVYPRKIDKDRARRAWRKLKVDSELAHVILAALREWKNCDQWQDERYIPHPATWLNGRRWEAPPPGGRRASEDPPERQVEEWT